MQFWHIGSLDIQYKRPYLYAIKLVNIFSPLNSLVFPPLRAIDCQKRSICFLSLAEKIIAVCQLYQCHMLRLFLKINVYYIKPLQTTCSQKKTKQKKNTIQILLGITHFKFFFFSQTMRFHLICISLGFQFYLLFLYYFYFPCMVVTIESMCH